MTTQLHAMEPDPAEGGHAVRTPTGEYYTPDHIVKIIEPACGSGSWLSADHEIRRADFDAGTIEPNSGTAAYTAPDGETCWLPTGVIRGISVASIAASLYLHFRCGWPWAYFLLTLYCGAAAIFWTWIYDAPVQDDRYGICDREEASIMPYAILTTGYQSRRPQDLLAWCQAHDAVVLDVRIRANSTQPGWSGYDLAAMFVDRYHQCPEWGNKALGTGSIEIADFAAGWAVCDALRQSRRVVLLCRCAQIEVCHRGVLASMIREQHSVECGELEFWPKVKDTNLFTETI